ncbi:MULTISPECIES: tail protein X [unclassified Erythrobacter]|uniref:tail protein X n=1 Tax=unclassified Erythrobacter TaxID=2633097 RepID=UPI0007B96E13|nr:MULTISPECIES: tail protein X [unclassified Erythrobacter]KZY95251.1 phage tail protein [Erythrobacter sp. HI0074]KZZ08586.1 phage tail protein [Erythrobacter sp. HI0077]
MNVLSIEGDTLDLICWRELGRTAGVVEAAVAANPGIADLGPVLPMGTPVVLPDVAIAAPGTRDIVQLWD